MKEEKAKPIIYMGGTIVLGGPNLADRLKRGEKVIFENELCAEFDLSLEPRLIDQVIKTDPWFCLECAELDIKTEDPDFDGQTLYIEFEDKNGNGIGIRINADQAVLIEDILKHFIAGCDAANMLRRKRHLDAPEEDSDEGEYPVAAPVS